MGCTSSSENNDPKTLAFKVSALEKSILAKYLSAEQLQTLAESFAVENVGENRIIFGQFENPAQALYVVAEGQVDLKVQHNTNLKYKPRPEDDDNEYKMVEARLLVKNKLNVSPATQTTTITTRRAGEFFGSRVLTNEACTYSAHSVGRSVVLKLTKLKWDAYSAKNEPLKMRILKCLGYQLEEALKSLQYMAVLDSTKLQLLAACFRFRTLEKEEQLFRRDDLGKEGNPLQYMLEGEVKVQQLEDGEEKVVAIVKKLQFFGEVGLAIHLPRSSTVTARKKCLFLELTQHDFRQFCLIAPEVLEAFRDKLDDYQIPLRYLIHNPILQDYLLQYMHSEKSPENLQFWIPAKDFRLSDNKDPDAIRTEATEIVEKFIKEGSDSQVNINGATRKDILTAMKGQINRDVFQKAEEEVLALMTRDTWGRFKGKNLFQQCLSKMTSTPNYKPKDPKAESAKPKPVIVDPGF